MNNQTSLGDSAEGDRIVKLANRVMEPAPVAVPPGCGCFEEQAMTDQPRKQSELRCPKCGGVRECLSGCQHRLKKVNRGASSGALQKDDKINSRPDPSPSPAPDPCEERHMSFWEWGVANKVREDLSACASPGNRYGHYRAAVATKRAVRKIREAAANPPCKNDREVLYRVRVCLARLERGDE